MRRLMIIPVVAASLLSTGCGLNNDNIIKDTKKCEAAGLKAEVLTDGFNNVTEVRCKPQSQ